MKVAAAIALLVFPGSLWDAGDRQFGMMNYEEAIASYESVLSLEPGRADILWRLARAHIALGEIVPQDQRLGLYRRAESYARAAIAADSLQAEGHTWLAAAIGNIALFSHKPEQVALAWELKQEIELAIALRPDDDAAHSIRGSFNHALGNVGWFERQLAAIFLGRIPEGGYEEAEESFCRAIELAPGVLRHQYELGMLYMDWGREEDAFTAFESALRLPIKVAGDTVAQRRMREILGRPPAEAGR